LAIVVKIETIYRKLNFGRAWHVALLGRMECRHPLLKLWFSCDAAHKMTKTLILGINYKNDSPVTIELVSTANKRMKRLLRVLVQEVHPDGVITSLETLATKRVLIHTGRESITLGPQSTFPYHIVHSSDK
jgi:hypothetical protein